MSCLLLFKNNQPSPFCAVYILRNVQSSTRVWADLKGAIPLKLTLPPTKVIYCQQLLIEDWKLMSPNSLLARMLTGLILCMTHVGKDNYCELLSLTLLSCPQDTICSVPPCPLLLRISPSPILQWYLSLGGRCVTHIFNV